MKKRPHIAFFSIAHPPHTNPTLPIASVLVRRGFRVTYVTSESFAPRVSALGAEVIICRSYSVSFSKLQEKHNPKLVAANLNGICELAIRMLAETTPFFEKNRPDVIIYDLVAFAGRILANRWNIPAIQISPQYAFDRENFSRQVPDGEFRAWILEQSENADRFFQRYGLAGEGVIFHREDLNIHLFPRAFQPEGTALSDNRCLFAGRCAAEQPYYGDWQRTDDGRPVVLVSTSTTYWRGPEYFRMFIDALDGLHLRVVLSIGDETEADAVGPLPEHFEIIQRTSHIRILPHASLFIFLGGTISTAEAAYHAVPLIAVTCGYFEPEWCADTNIVRLGLGLHLRQADTDAVHIREAVIEARANEQILKNVDEMGRIVRREPGSEEVVNRIEAFLQGRIG